MENSSRVTYAKIAVVVLASIICLGYLLPLDGAAQPANEKGRAGLLRDFSGNDGFLPLFLRPLPPGFLPECAPQTHNSREWHALTNEMGNCHFNHEHKDNPHLLDDVFGTQIYGWAGGSISYPWQTGDGHGENVHKHESYGWLVLRDLPPSMSNSDAMRPSGADNAFVKHLRIQSHLDMSVVGAPTRFHSSYIEVMICYKTRPTDCGIARFGGHLDYGELRADGNWVPLSGDPEEYDGVMPPAVPERNYDNVIAKRSHSSLTNNVSWLGRFHWRGGPVTPVTYAGFDHRTEDAFGPINPADLTQIILTDPAIYNNSTHGLDFFVLRMRKGFADQNDRINASGFSTRYGLDLNPECTAPGHDCVPFSFENVPALNGINIMPRTMHEYDTSPSGQQWIDYPN